MLTASIGPTRLFSGLTDRLFTTIAAKTPAVPQMRTDSHQREFQTMMSGRHSATSAKGLPAFTPDASMNSTPRDRAYLLVQRRRWMLAEKEFRRSLVEEPNHYYDHAMLAYCLLQQQQLEEALREAQEAVHLGPEHPHPHFVLAQVFLERNQFAEAEQSLREALRLNPLNADYFAWLTHLYYSQSRWQEALDAANQGLAIDAQHVECLNRRGLALSQLGKIFTAKKDIGAALQIHPEFAYSHTNMGWLLLKHRQPGQALKHFREALRLDPNMERAQSGFVEALRSRFLVYRLIRSYISWMENNSDPWLLAFAVWGFVSFLLRKEQMLNPQMRHRLILVLFAFAVVGTMTWLAVPLFNLMLRMSRFGRLALSREEIRTSYWVGGSLLLSILCLSFSHAYSCLAPVALMCGLMSLPLSNFYAHDPGVQRKIMFWCTLVMGLLLLVSAACWLLAEQFEWRWEPRHVTLLTTVGDECFVLFWWGALAMQLSTFSWMPLFAEEQEKR